MAKKIGSTGPLLHPYQNGMTLPRRSSRQVLRSSVMRAVVIVERVFSVANIWSTTTLLKKITVPKMQLLSIMGVLVASLAGNSAAQADTSGRTSARRTLSGGGAHR